MTIKISQLGNLTIAADTTSIPVIDYVANTLTTLQANVSTLRTYFTSNLYTALTANIATVNASITAANVGMKGYIDAATSGENTAITAANVGMTGYVNSQVTAANTSANTANIIMTGYVNSQVTAANTAANIANTSVVSYINQQITAANTAANIANLAMTGYVNSQSFYSNTKVAAYLPTYNGNIGSLGITGNTAVYGVLNVGFPSPITFGNVVVNAVNTANSYVQLNIQNIDSIGTNNSADFIATAPDGTDTSKFIDMGINGNNFVSSMWTISGKDDGYLYVNTGNLTLGTDTLGTTVKVHVGGTLAANVVATFSNNSVTVTGNVIVSGKYIKLTPGTVANLVYANIAGAGAKAFVTDSTSNTFANLVVGGGTYYVPVFSNGTNWYVG
jgi:hypothetical protein